MVLPSLLICLAATSPALCDDYYVDAQSLGGPSDDSGPGSINSPWRTLARISADQEPRPEPGDTVWVREGVYNEPLILTRGGTAGRPLTIKAYADERPVIGGGSELARGIALPEIGSADYVTIEGLTVRNLKEGAVGIYANSRTGLTIRDVGVSGARIGVWLGACTDAQLRDSEIHHNREGNVLIDTRCADVIVADCHVHHCDEGHSLSVYAPGDGVRAEGRLTSLTPTGDGLARFGIEGVDLSQVRDGTLTGQDADGSVRYPSMVLLFASDAPAPDGLPLPGGTVRLADGREWLRLRAEPEWNGKPYSPDGSLGQFEVGDMDPEDLARAKYAYIAYLFDPGVANTDIQLLRNEVDHGAVQGIWVQRADGVLIESNRTHHNGASGIQIESLCRRVWIEGNTSYANATRYNHETGIWLDETIDAVVQDNICAENQKGMGVTQCEWVLVRRNILHDNRAQHVGGDVEGCRRNAGGFWFSGGRHNHLGAPPGASQNAFVHNTLVGNGTSKSTWGGVQHGLAGYPRVGANVILYNLVQGCEGAAPIYLGAPPEVLDGNLYWAQGGFGAFVRTDEGETRYDLSDPGEFSAYRAATGYDTGSRVAQVNLVDPAGGDFRPARDSAAVGRGVPLARTTAGGEGREIPVDRVSCFSAGLRDRNGNVLKEGDVIRVGEATARVVAIDRERRVLTVDAELTWEQGDPVACAYDGGRPNVGA